MRFLSTSRLLLALAALALFAPRAASAQDLDLFGFFQAQYRYSEDQGTGSPSEISSFSLQQLNAFVMKDFDGGFSGFVNAELTNSFSTDRGWGALKLEEAWGRYNYSSKLNVKAGLLVPTFNNLNEVKNRTPLLPYIFRPMAYESSFAGVFDTEGFAPNQANVQVYGALPLGDLRFDYAAFVGNNSPDFAATESMGSVVSGTDLKTSKLVGGRVGLRWRSLKVGASATSDQRRVSYDLVDLTGQPAEVLGQLGLPAEIAVGDVGRTRFGADASFYRGRLFGEAEMILVSHDTDAEQDGLLSLANQATQGALTGQLDMAFYYAMLGVNVTDRVYGYGMYNFVKDEGISAVQAQGVDFYGVGVGYRPIDGIVAKAQYIRGDVRENPLSDYKGNYVFAALSVSF